MMGFDKQTELVRFLINLEIQAGIRVKATVSHSCTVNVKIGTEKKKIIAGSVESAYLLVWGGGGPNILGQAFDTFMLMR